MHSVPLILLKLAMALLFHYCYPWVTSVEQTNVAILRAAIHRPTLAAR